MRKMSCDRGMQLQGHQNSSRQFDPVVVIVSQAVDFCLIRFAKFGVKICMHVGV